MKVPKTFRLSEEAVAVLDNQPNATEYLEALILQGATGGLTEKRVREIIKEELDRPTIKNNDLASLGVTTGAAFVPKPPDPVTGYPCCQGKSPCKHWQWDSVNTYWTNSLTGATRDE